MDLSFNSKMEAYYQKFFELQEKLRKSEEERLKLEMKFNELVQISREEEQAHYKKLRAQYKKFLEEDRKRQERNEKIVRLLERIDSRLSMLTSKTERIKMLRRQYQSYLQRVSRRPVEKREYISSKIDEELPRKDRAPVAGSYDLSVLKKAYGKSNDEKIAILDKYLQSLKAEKVRAEPENETVSDLKYLDEMARKLDTGFNSNEANSIADEIMKSIYARHYKKDTYKEDINVPEPSTLANNSDKDKTAGYSDPCSNNILDAVSFAQAKKEIHQPAIVDGAYANVDGATFEEASNISTNVVGKQFQTFEEGKERYQEALQKHSNQLEPEVNIDMNEFNKSPARGLLTRAVRRFKVSKEKQPDPGDVPQGYSQEQSEPISASQQTQQQQQWEQQQWEQQQLHLQQQQQWEQEQLRQQQQQRQWEQEQQRQWEQEQQRQLEQQLKQQQEEERQRQLEIKQQQQQREQEELQRQQQQVKQQQQANKWPPQALTKAIRKFKVNKEKQSLRKVDRSPTRPLEPPKTPSRSPSPSSSSKWSPSALLSRSPSPSSANKWPPNALSKAVRKFKVNKGKQGEKPPLNKAQPKDNPSKAEIDLTENEKQSTKSAKGSDNEANAKKRETEEEDATFASEITLTSQNQKLRDNNGSVGYENLGDNGQIKGDTQQGYSQQPVEYPSTVEVPGQDYVDSGKGLQQYDENGQPGYSYDENSQQIYETNDDQTQQYSTGPQYGESNQQFNENAQPTQQYEESSQPTEAQYSEPPVQPYDEISQPPQQYYETAQPTQQYDQSGQQYEDGGQPTQQYDESALYDPSDQPVQQYDQHGQPLQQYDENGQPIEQYDESGQPIQHQYGEAVQYDANGQPVYFNQGDVQYDENGQIIQQYDQNGQGVYDESYQQYDANAQMQQYETSQYQADQDLERVKEGKSDKLAKKKSVLDLLDTDSESTKPNNNNKVSNDSDFDFSNG